MSGIIIGGFGVGGLIFDNVFTHVINPGNESVNEDGFYPDYVDNRFKGTMLLMYGCWLLIAIIGFITIFPGPAKP